MFARARTRLREGEWAWGKYELGSLSTPPLACEGAYNNGSCGSPGGSLPLPAYAQVNASKNSIKIAEMSIAKAEADIKELQERVVEDTQQEQEACQQRLRALQENEEKLRQAGRAAQEQLQLAETTLSNAKNNVRQQYGKLQDAKREVGFKQGRIKDQQARRAGKLRALGHQMEQMVKHLQRHSNRFGSKPIGPLGMLIRYVLTSES